MFDEVTAVVPASGFSKRMGSNKLLLDYKGKPVIVHVIDTLSYFRWKEIIVVTADTKVDSVLDDYDVHIIHNETAYLGQSQSVVRAVRHSQDSSGWLFISADMPLMSTSIIDDVMKSAFIDNNHIIVPRYRGKNGQPVYFPYNFRRNLLCLKGDQGGRQIIRDHPESVLYIDYQEVIPSFDLDTPEDYEALIRKDSSL